MSWATDRDGSAGYVTVTTLASIIDEAVPFCVVFLSDLPSAFHTAMSNASDTDGKTIRVSTSDGATQLACVPLGVNTGTDTGCLIFLGTGMSASVDVDYRIYVGNAALTMPTASGGMGEQAVFAAYAGLYFPGMATRDFTAGGRTLTAVNTPTTDTSGYEGITAAKYASASSQYHKYEGTPCVTTWPGSIEALAYANNVTADMNVAGIHVDASVTNQFSIQFLGTGGSDPVRGVLAGNGGSYSLPTKTSFVASTWYNVALTRSGTTTGTSSVYINGGTAGTDATTLTAAVAMDRTAIGRQYYNSSQAGTLNYLDGRVAWVGFSTSERSANYLATQKQNWDGNLYSTGSWTPNSIAPGTTGWVLFQTAAQTATSDVDWATITNALVDDATAATVTLNDTSALYSETLKLTNPNYGVTIPAGAPSYTVELRIKRSGQTSSAKEIHDKIVKFIDDTGTLVGDNKADLVTIWPSSAATKDYTVTGVTFDGTEFTSAAGIAIQADGSSTNGNTTTSVFVAWIKVSWTGTDTSANARGFFALMDS